jgi:hypothetical protein
MPIPNIQWQTSVLKPQTDYLCAPAEKPIIKTLVYVSSGFGNAQNGREHNGSHHFEVAQKAR